jgi:hypothetical protein
VSLAGSFAFTKSSPLTIGLDTFRPSILATTGDSQHFIAFALFSFLIAQEAPMNQSMVQTVRFCQ